MMHLSWFIALVLTCAVGAMLGRHTLNWGVSPLVWQDKRQAHFATISSSLAELERNDIAFSEGLAIDRLRTALIALAGEDEGWHCVDDESTTLARASLWFDAHPDHRATHELQPFIAEGLRACEKRARPRSANYAGARAQSQFIALPVVPTNRGLVSST
jgi:hypothetical protein